MTRPRLLDLFCGAGGASVGYHRAGFDIVGVDNRPQPRYPYGFVQADALNVLSDPALLTSFIGGNFAAIHASPPCQHYAPVTRWRGTTDHHPDLVDTIRQRLIQTGVPWVIENVPTAPVRPHFMLCGSAFGLGVRRHRWFETSWSGLTLTTPCQHRGLLPFMHKGERAYADAMGCEWMSNREAREAVPPVFTEHIGTQLLDHLKAGAA